MPQLVPNRIVIYPKDVQNITGKRERTARKLLSDIRKKLGKLKSEFITIDEFCSHTGLNKEQVQEFLLY
jgi:archaellum biogenesis ATPase FlaH